MALTLTFTTNSGITISDAYGLITDFRLLADGRLESVLSIWASPQTCGEGKERIGSQVFNLGPEHPQYQELYDLVADALYDHLVTELNAEDYEGQTIRPGSLIQPIPENTEEVSEQ